MATEKKPTDPKAEAPKKAEPKTDPHAGHGHEGHAHAAKETSKPGAAKAAAEKKEKAPEAKPAADKKAKADETKAPAKKPSRPAAKPARDEKVKVVDKPTPKYQPNAKPAAKKELRARLALRDQIDSRRPHFRRQQWYEYKRLANSGWRKPTGVDSAMRRHFGYEQSVVRIGFGGPRDVRGLHSSGFREVRIEQVGDLKKIDPKTQAARVSGTLGARKLKLVYAEADKLGVRILNRRRIE